MALTIRRLTGPAPPQVRTLFARVWATSLPGHAPDLDTVTAGEALYLAWQGRHLAGLASVWEPDRFLHFLFVDPVAQRTGVGRALVAHLAACYPPPLTLKCLRCNEAALAFYRATGWRACGVGGAGLDAYVLLRYGQDTTLNQEVL